MIKYIWGSHYITKTRKSFKAEKNGLTALRTVSEYEIEIFSESGGAVISNGVEYSISKGDILIAVPGDKRQSKPHYECYSVKFLCDDFELASKINEIAGVNHFEDYPSLISQVKEIYSLCGGINKELVIDAKIRTVIATLYENFTKYRLVNHIHRVSGENAKRFISDNFDKKITLSDIASHSGLSSSHLHKVFKELYGISPNDFLIMKRIAFAKSLLLNNLISIDEVAVKCGFSSRAYFDVTFKKITGITPANFRKI